MASLAIRDVRKSFGAVDVVRGVSIDVADGEFVVLVGPSGCGKSTLLRMIAGLETISSGEICIGPRVVNDVPPKARDIAMVFQNYALYPHMTVADNMSFGLRLKKMPARRDRRCGSSAPPDSGTREAFGLSAPPIIGRATAARRYGTGDRARPAGVPVR